MKTWAINYNDCLSHVELSLSFFSISWLLVVWKIIKLFFCLNKTLICNYLLHQAEHSADQEERSLSVWFSSPQHQGGIKSSKGPPWSWRDCSSHPCGEAEGAGIGQPGEGKVQRASHQHLLILEGMAQREQSQGLSVVPGQEAQGTNWHTRGCHWAPGALLCCVGDRALK